MAIYGIIGDIHGNKEALLAILGLLRARGVKEILSVGDIVGFNADSEECIEIVKENQVRSIAGNHDLISIGGLDFSRCSDKAAYALRRTRSSLSAAGAKFLAALPLTMAPEQHFALVHGSVRDVQEYVRTRDQVKENSALLQAGIRVCFFGHTHEQRVFELDEESVAEIHAEGVIRLDGNRRYFINSGSVDASRKSGRKLAECAIWDSTESTVEFCRVPYDHVKAEAKAEAAGYRMNAFAAWTYSFLRRIRSRWETGIRQKRSRLPHVSAY